MWLQRHEASWLQESYLIWVEKRLEGLWKAGEVNPMDEDEAEEDVEVDDQVQLDVTQCDFNITQPRGEAHALSNLNLTHIPNSFAKSPPHKNLSVEKLMEKFGTTNFLPALTSFLRYILPDSTINAKSLWPVRHIQTNSYLFPKEHVSWRGEFGHGQGQDIDLCKCKRSNIGEGIPLRYCVCCGRPTFTQTRRWIIRYIFGGLYYNIKLF